MVFSGPAGGSCRVCGSVEHFQKDCPEHQAASESLRQALLQELHLTSNYYFFYEAQYKSY